MKRKYISPQAISHGLVPEQMMITSQLDQTSEKNSIILSNDEADEFTSRRHNLWGDEGMEEDF